MMDKFRERLIERQWTLSAIGLVGFALGGWRGARLSFRKYIMENLICPPRNSAELILYSKQRHYRTLRGFFGRGSVYVCSFLLAAIGVDGCRALGSSVSSYKLAGEVAALGLAGASAGGLIAGLGQRVQCSSRGLIVGTMLGSLLCFCEELQDRLRGQILDN
jgi:hypothetical protein